MKHVHHDIIAEWIKDTLRVVQCRREEGCNWEDCDDEPRWVPRYEYRFKPVPKPDVVGYVFAKHIDGYGVDTTNERKPPRNDWLPNLRLTFDGETGALKSAEVLA